MAPKRFVQLTCEGDIFAMAVDSIVSFAARRDGKGTRLVVSLGGGREWYVDEPVEAVWRLLREADQ